MVSLKIALSAVLILICFSAFAAKTKSKPLIDRPSKHKRELKQLLCQVMLTGSKSSSEKLLKDFFRNQTLNEGKWTRTLVVTPEKIRVLAPIFTASEWKLVLEHAEFFAGERVHFLVQELFSKIPQYYQTASELGLSHQQIYLTLVALLHSVEYSHARVGYMLETLTRMLTLLNKQPWGNESDFKIFLQIILDSGISNSQGPMMHSLPALVDAGFSFSEIRQLLLKIHEDRGSFAAQSLRPLEFLAENLGGYAVDPAIAFSVLNKMLDSHVLDGANDDRLTLLSDAVEISHLRKENPDLVFMRTLKLLGQTKYLETARDTMNFSEKLEKRLASNAPKLLTGPQTPSTGAFPDFANFNGRLKHSSRRYKLVRSYEQGLKDLSELAVDLFEEREGAFVFDPDTSTWYSLGGKTQVYMGRRAVRTEFLAQDLSELSHAPVFVHIHPKSLIHLTFLPHGSVSAHFKEAIENYYEFMPSRADIQAFTDFISESKKPIAPRFLIVHREGTTEITVDTRRVEELKQLAPNFLEQKDAVLLEANLGDYQNLNRRQMIDQLATQISKKTNGLISIQMQWND